MKPYMMKQEDVLEALNVSTTIGLTDADVLESRSKYGENGFTENPPVTLLKRFCDALREPMIIMLIFAAIITLAVNLVRFFTDGEGDFIECVGIFSAILLSAFITVFMEGKSARAFQALSKINEDGVIRVIRNGKTLLLPQREAVVGDILIVGTGDKLPADGRIIECSDLTSDESALTGESHAVKKECAAVFEDEKTPIAERLNMLYSGCYIVSGSGKMVVTDVGDNTEFGKIARELSGTEKTTTPLQEKLAILGKKIAILGTSAAVLVFIIQVIRFIISGTASFETVSEAFITSIVLIVASVPEGLPTIVAISLSLNIIKMSKQNALVKKMIACETIGCINVICSDKTGTLTENKMTVVSLYSNGKVTPPEKINDENILANICLNSTADIDIENNIIKFIGNPTECALLTAASKNNVNYKDERDKHTVVHVFPFSSEEKDMTTVVRQGEMYIAYTKGSPEKVLRSCSMSGEDRNRIEQEIQSFQEKSCRIIALAHKIYTTEPEFIEAEIESSLTFDGFAAITDPLRSDVYQAVESCRQAGIDIKMLTGDNLITARAIASELDLLDGDFIAAEAAELEALDDKTLTELLPRIRVIARSTPTIKMRVVNLLKASGNVVAVTGDGINDAPALKNSDVGIAMGITGTDVSKEASDIILLDDSFSTIARAIKWGRNIYDNFQKFIQFQLTVNISSVIVVLSSIILGFASPFTALQLLWINIVMDGPLALTLGLEPIKDGIMNRRPIKRNASIISKAMLVRISLGGIYISIIFMLQHFTNFIGCDIGQEGSVLFTLFVLFQLFNAVNCRELGRESGIKGIWKNKSLLLCLIGTFAVQVLITQFAGSVFNTAPLPLVVWGKIILTAFSLIALSELIKLITRICHLIKKSAA